MSHMPATAKKIAFSILFSLLAIPAKAQVAVALSPVDKQQFLSNTGVPLAGGCLFTYQAGTVTPAPTYTDSTGSVTATNPLILDAGGFAPNSGIWLSQQAYKFQLKSAGGVNCASGSLIRTVDGVNAWSVLSLANAWASLQTFNGGIASSSFAGTAANQSTAGLYRLSSTDQVCWRNNANSANVCLNKNSSDALLWGTDTVITRPTQAITLAAKIYFAAAGCGNTSAASFWDLPTSTPAVAACVTGTNTQKGVLNYAQTAGGFSSQTSVLLPADFTSTVDFRLIWLTSATSGTAQWKIFWVCTPVNASATDDPAFANSVTISSAVPGVANQLQTASSTGNTLTGCSAGNMLHLKVFRDGNVDGVAATLSFDGLEMTFRRNE